MLIAGGGGLGWFWADVRSRASEALKVQVCSYDRPGAGWSDSPNQPYSIAREAATLNAVLNALGASDSVLVVAHSYGAFVAQEFARAYRPRVSALVLVEPNTVFFQDRHPDAAGGDRQLARGLRFTVPLGIARWSFRRQLASAFRKRFPADAEMLVDIFSTSKFMNAQAAQSLALEQTFAALRDWRPASDLRVIVISRGKADRPPAAEAIWREGQERLIKEHALGRFVVAQESGHDVPRQEPRVIVRELQQLVSVLGRAPRPLRSQDRMSARPAARR